MDSWLVFSFVQTFWVSFYICTQTEWVDTDVDTDDDTIWWQWHWWWHWWWHYVMTMTLMMTLFYDTDDDNDIDDDTMWWHRRWHYNMVTLTHTLTPCVSVAHCAWHGARVSGEGSGGADRGWHRGPPWLPAASPGEWQRHYMGGSSLFSLPQCTGQLGPPWIYRLATNRVWLASEDSFEQTFECSIFECAFPCSCEIVTFKCGPSHCHCLHVPSQLH